VAVDLTRSILARQTLAQKHDGEQGGVSGGGEFESEHGRKRQQRDGGSPQESAAEMDGIARDVQLDTPRR
jgi:hypothetical protein